MGLQYTGEGVVKLIMGAAAGECAVAAGASHAHLVRHTVDVVAAVGGGYSCPSVSCLRSQM